MSFSKWDKWLVEGGEMPTVDLPEVPEPSQGEVKYLYVCWDCGKANNFWYRLCENCDAKLDTEERG